MATSKKSKKSSPLDILNRVRDKARLGEKPYQQIQVVKMKAGKIKFQLLALNDDFLFAQRRQHVIPTIPHDDDPNSKWMVVNCEGENCPICRAAESFKKSGIEIEDVNAEYKPKYPFKSLRSVFTQPDHYLLCARILVDQCDDGNYLPKDAEIGSTQLIQFSKTALNNLMAAYEDFIDDFADSQEEEDAEAPALFAIFDGDDTADSLTISCRITNQPFSATFSFSKVSTVSLDGVDKSKLEILEKGFEPNNEEYVAKCIKRIRDIQNYFVNGGNISEDDDADSLDDEDDDDLPFSMGKKSAVSEKKGKTMKPAPIEEEEDEEEETEDDEAEEEAEDEAEDEAEEEAEEDEEEEKPAPKKTSAAKKTSATAAKKNGNMTKKSATAKKPPKDDDDMDDFDLDEGDL